MQPVLIVNIYMVCSTLSVLLIVSMNGGMLHRYE